MSTQAKTRQAQNVREAVPFFRVADILASQAFYEKLGFEKVDEWVHDGRMRWCALRSGSASLMLQEFWYDGPNKNVTQEKQGVGVSICFMCEDALAVYHAAKSNGLEPRQPFVGNGLWVVGFSDPDGYVLEFESTTEVPEGTRYDG